MWLTKPTRNTLYPKPVRLTLPLNFQLRLPTFRNSNSQVIGRLTELQLSTCARTFTSTSFFSCFFHAAILHNVFDFTNFFKIIYEFKNNLFCSNISHSHSNVTSNGTSASLNTVVPISTSRDNRTISRLS